jgi:hypothetical protein
VGVSRSALVAILSGLVLAAIVAPAASSAGESYDVAVSLGSERVFAGTGTLTSATTLVVRGSGADLGSWSKVSGLDVTFKLQGGQGEVVTYRVVDAWPSAGPQPCNCKTLTLTLSTTSP